jgi:hypothetical protein
MQRFIEAVVDTDASYDLTTPAIVAAALNIPNDAALAARVTAYSKMVADLCDRTFVTATVTESFRLSVYEDRRIVLKLDRWPVQQIISIVENDVTLDSTNYEFNKDNGLVWRSASYDWWGFCRGLTVVNYIAGYILPEQAPPSLALATTELIYSARLFASGQLNLRSVSHGDRSVSYQRPVSGSGGGTGVVSPAILSLIEPYRRLVLGG